MRMLVAATTVALHLARTPREVPCPPTPSTPQDRDPPGSARGSLAVRGQGRPGGERGQQVRVHPQYAGLQKLSEELEGRGFVVLVSRATTSVARSPALPRRSPPSAGRTTASRSPSSRSSSPRRVPSSRRSTPFWGRAARSQLELRQVPSEQGGQGPRVLPEQGHSGFAGAAGGDRGGPRKVGTPGVLRALSESRGSCASKEGSWIGSGVTCGWAGGCSSREPRVQRHGGADARPLHRANTALFAVVYNVLLRRCPFPNRTGFS